MFQMEDNEKTNGINQEENANRAASLLCEDDVAMLEYYLNDDGARSYFGRGMQFLDDFIESGVKEGRFTEEQAREDLQIALWYAYIYNNLDRYGAYYSVTEWMPASEKNAKGCGAWYYRYACALLYTGQLEAAREYAERGVAEDPSYPWGWLQAAKLRAHFGDKAGAFAAVERGLELEPDDYEFTTLRREIEEGRTLEEMEFHWINPDSDAELQEGLDADAEAKLRQIDCIRLDEEKLDRIKAILGIENLEHAGPWRRFTYKGRGREIDMVFRMNEAGLSKTNPEWLTELRGKIDGEWAEMTDAEGRTYPLAGIAVALDYTTDAYYLTDAESGEAFIVHRDKNGEIIRREEGGEEAPQREPELYTEDETAAITAHIEKYYGKIKTISHDNNPGGVSADICIIPPSIERDYYTLVTCGLGAHVMDLPEELKDSDMSRAELMICLPKDWKISDGGDVWQWPANVLRWIAEIASEPETWIGWGHTIGGGRAFSRDTELCAAFLAAPQNVKKEAFRAALPNGEKVCFYLVIPIYQEELDYKIAHSADGLSSRLADAGASFVVDPQRPNTCEGGADEVPPELMDDAAWHLKDLRGKNLPVDEIAAYGHMAIYLRWCIERGLMSADFTRKYGNVIKSVLEGKTTDLREFVRGELGGRLLHTLFDETGDAFAWRYYDYSDTEDPFYPKDVDKYAESFFGKERCESGEMQDEEYLFIPFDENYYKALAETISRRFDDWTREQQTKR